MLKLRSPCLGKGFAPDTEFSEELRQSNQGDGAAVEVDEAVAGEIGGRLKGPLRLMKRR